MLFIWLCVCQYENKVLMRAKVSRGWMDNIFTQFWQIFSCWWRDVSPSGGSAASGKSSQTFSPTAAVACQRRPAPRNIWLLYYDCMIIIIILWLYDYYNNIINWCSSMPKDTCTKELHNATIYYQLCNVCLNSLYLNYVNRCGFLPTIGLTNCQWQYRIKLSTKSTYQSSAIVLNSDYHWSYQVCRLYFLR